MKKSSPESPTTARELDFDDDVQDTGIAGTSTSTGPASTPSAEMAKPGSGEDVAPPKPPRPVDPRQQAEATLKEAFPSIDASVVKAVLAASGGRVEPAFNALLGMTPSPQAESIRSDSMNKACPIPVHKKKPCHPPSHQGLPVLPRPHKEQRQPRRTSSRRMNNMHVSWLNTTAEPACAEVREGDPEEIPLCQEHGNKPG